MDVRGFVEGLAADPDVAPSLSHVRDLPAVTPRVRPFPEDLPEVVVQRLGLLGVEGLYPHQAAGLDALRAGRHAILSTGTASGKTLVYDLAFAARAISTPKATALFLFPTKALARDQLRQIRALKIPQIRAAVSSTVSPGSMRPSASITAARSCQLRSTASSHASRPRSWARTRAISSSGWTGLAT